MGLLGLEEGRAPPMVGPWRAGGCGIGRPCAPRWNDWQAIWMLKADTLPQNG